MVEQIRRVENPVIGIANNWLLYERLPRVYEQFSRKYD